MSDGGTPGDGMDEAEEPDDWGIGPIKPRDESTSDGGTPDDDAGDVEEPYDWLTEDVVLPDDWSREDDILIVMEEEANERGHRLRQYAAMLKGGAALRRLKKGLPHGEWTPHLEKMGIEETKATRRMRLAATGLTAQQILDQGGQTKVLKKYPAPKRRKCGHPKILKAPKGGCCQCRYDALPLDQDVFVDEKECGNKNYHSFGVIVYHGLDEAFTYACMHCPEEISQSQWRTRRELLKTEILEPSPYATDTRPA